MNGRRKLVLANRRNSVRVNCVAQFRRMSRTMLPCRRSYICAHGDFARQKKHKSLCLHSWPYTTLSNADRLSGFFHSQTQQ